MRQETMTCLREVATKSIARILDQGLAKSTWKDNNEQAYNDLLAYREDMIEDVLAVLTVRFRDWSIGGTRHMIPREL